MPTGINGNGDPTAHDLRRALLGELLSGEHERLGDALLDAQSEFALHASFTELLAIFRLFGDPALTIPAPLDASSARR